MAVVLLLVAEPAASRRTGVPKSAGEPLPVVPGMAGEITTPHNNQTRARPDQVRGELRGRIAQLAMMATFRRSWPLLQRLVPLLADLARVGVAEDCEEIVVYIAATTTREPQHWHRFADAVRRRVPGGGELMNKTERMWKIYGDVREQEGRREGRKEGELRGKVLTIEALLARDVPWTTIQGATGIDQATFHRLKHQLEVADGGSPHHPS